MNSLYETLVALVSINNPLFYLYCALCRKLTDTVDIVHQRAEALKSKIESMETPNHNGWLVHNLGSPIRIQIPVELSFDDVDLENIKCMFRDAMQEISERNTRFVFQCDNFIYSGTTNGGSNQLQFYIIARFAECNPESIAQRLNLMIEESVRLSPFKYAYTIEIGRIPIYQEEVYVDAVAQWSAKHPEFDARLITVERENLRQLWMPDQSEPSNLSFILQLCLTKRDWKEDGITTIFFDSKRQGQNIETLGE